MNNTTTLGISRKQFYWSCQLGGWMLWLLLNAFFQYLKGEFDSNIAFDFTLYFLFGISLTQLLRWVIVKFNWLEFSVLKIIPRILGMNILMGIAVALLQSSLNKISIEGILLNSLPFISAFLFWSIIYYLIHFVENYKKAEIENFRWQAAINETELNKLKSQLNPHFMFNAMNSIRALVAENPERAKDAITQLANLLRNTLQMGKYKLIPFSQEIEAVKNYLAIESVRFEERLKIEWNISPNSVSFEVPPLMIQTLVENGIKHGIAKLPEGGLISITTTPSENGLEIIIRNSGQYDETLIPESGFGVRNTLERLALLFNGAAKFSISNENKSTVVTKLFIPIISNQNKNTTS